MNQHTIRGKTGVIIFIPFCLIVILLTIFFLNQAEQKKEVIDETMQQQPKDERVKPSLTAAVSQVKPGETFKAGVLMELAPDWHIYWQNPGDSGMATTLSWEGPEGCRITPLEYPVPQQFMMPGEIVGYGYKGTVLFPAEVELPESIPTNTTFKLRVKASWLSCKQSCIPGSATLEMRLPVGQTTKVDEKNSRLIKRWLEKLPARKPLAEMPFEIDIQKDFNKETGAGRLTASLDWKTAVRDAECYPYQQENVLIKALRFENEASPMQLHVDYSYVDKTMPVKDPLQFLVNYVKKDGTQAAVILPVMLQR